MNREHALIDSKNKKEKGEAANEDSSATEKAAPGAEAKSQKTE